MKRTALENVIKQRPSLKDLVFELTEGVHSSWPKKDQLLTIVLNVKYAIFHKIDITNWCPLSHKFGFSVVLATLISQIG